MTEASDLQNIKTLGDSPIDPQIEDELDDNDGIQQQIYQREFKTSLNYFQQMKNFSIESQAQNYTQPAPISMNSNVSLTQLMGTLSPKEFAHQFVYGEKKIQNKKKISQNINQQKLREPYSNIGKENISNNLSQYINQNQRQSVNQNLSNQKDSDVILQQRSTDCFNRESQKNSICVTLYTELSKQILQDFDKNRQKNNSISLRPFSPNKQNELLLSPDRVEQLQKVPPPKEYVQYQQQLIQRLHSEKDDLETKKLMLMQQYLSNEKEKCTFTPQINQQINFRPQSQGQVQSLSQNDQIVLTTQNNDKQFVSPKKMYEQNMKLIEQYQEKLYKKKKQKEEQEEAQLKTKPSISKRSQILAQHKHQESALPENVVDRLCTLKKRNQSVDVAIAIKNIEQEATFQPQITMKGHLIARDQKVEDILYLDAKRRQEKKENVDSQTVIKPSQIQQLAVSNSSGKITTKSNKTSGASSMTQNKITIAATNKFIKEFNEAFIQTSTPEEDNGEILTYARMLSLLQALGFIESQKTNEEPTTSSQSQQLKQQASISSVSNTPNCVNENLVKNMWVQLNGNLYTDRSYVPFNDHQISQTQIKKLLTMKNRNGAQCQDQRIPSALMPDERPPDSQQPQKQNEEQQQPQYINISVHLNNNNQIYKGKSLQVASDKNLFEQKVSAVDGEGSQQEQIQDLMSSQLFQDCKLIGTFDLYQNLILSEDNYEQLRKTFSELVMRRISKKDKKSYKSPEKQIPFSPQISNISKQLALNKRERIVDAIKKNQPEIVNIDLNYLLCYQQYQTEAEKNSLKQQFQESELSNCTFRPITKDFAIVEKIFAKNKKKNGGDLEDDIGQYSEGRKVCSSAKALGAHRTLELYSLTKPSNQKRDRNKVEIEYEKECDECTFTPDITISQKCNVTTKQSMIKDIDKNIQRFQKARLNQQTLQSMMDKGNTFNKKKLQNLQKNVADTIEKEQVQKQEQLRFRLEQQSLRRNTSPNRSSGIRPTFHDSSIQNTKTDSNRISKYKENEQEQQDAYQFEDNNNFQKTGCSSKTQDDDRIPLLFVDVNIEEDKQARIVVYEGEKSEDLANRFAQEHNLDMTMKNRLKDLLDMQINSLLSKIEEEHEEHNSDSEITK